MAVPVVLASTSVYRAAVLRDAGRVVDVIDPAVDEEALRHLFHVMTPGGYALELARRKARSVLDRLEGEALVIGADQVGVRIERGVEIEVGKPRRAAEAIDQLMAVSGRSYRLINGVVVVRRSDGAEVGAVDTHVVHMNPYGLHAASDYVERFRPFDCVGGCRLEDESGLVARVEGSGPDGVMGMPLGVVDSLLESACPP